MSSNSFAAWRAAVSQKSQAYTSDGPPPGLLLDSSVASEQWFSGALRARARVPPQACGVSLAFLTQLASSFVGVGLEGKARCTAMVVAKFLGPAGCIQPFAPIYQRSVSNPQQQQLMAGGSVEASETAGEEGSSKGAAHTLKKIGSINSPPGSDIREARTRLWDVIAPHWCGKPSYYVAHMWSADFVEMLETLVDRISRQPEHRSSREAGDAKDELSSTFVWLDFLALPQQFLGSSTTSDGPVYGPPPGTFDLLSVKEAVTSCERGVVIVLDRNMAILNRVWPLYEVWLAAYYCPQDTSTSRVYVAIARDTEVDALLHLQTSCLGGLDLSRCSTTKPEDKQHVLREVRHAAGQKRMQMLTSDSILRAARGWLRWSGDAQDLGMYAALMLQSKEYTQLQYVLNAVDEIYDDEATLKEIRDLFEIYDEDGTGSLEEDEFTQVLAMAGFGLEESRVIFRQVDLDGGGSVDLEEFEAWWIQTQRQQNRACRPKPELTVSGLVQNLKGLAGLLRRKEHEGAAAKITEMAEGLHAIAVGPRSPFPDGTLPPSEVFGDWRLVANTLGFKITANDLRPALRLLHGLLMANVDLLMLDANPASLLPSPSSLGTDVKLQRVVLAWFMALMAELLSRNHRTIREANFFLREAIDLSTPERHDMLVNAYSTRKIIDATITKARAIKNTRNDAQMESIVTDMVRLKHGKDTIVSNKLVAEANVSLSAWMASSKAKKSSRSTQGAKQGQKKSAQNASSLQVQSVINFTNNYLSGNAPEQPTENNEEANRDSNSNFVARPQPSPPKKDWYEGKSHSALAHTLGVSCLAAIERSKRGEPLQELTEDSDAEGDELLPHEIEAGSTEELRTHEGVELLDRFQQKPEVVQGGPLSPGRGMRNVVPLQHWPSDSGTGVLSQPLPQLSSSTLSPTPPLSPQLHTLQRTRFLSDAGQQPSKANPGRQSSFAMPSVQVPASCFSLPQHLQPLEQQGRPFTTRSRSLDQLPKINSHARGNRGVIADLDKSTSLILPPCSPQPPLSPAAPSSSPLALASTSSSSLQDVSRHGPSSAQLAKSMLIPHSEELTATKRLLPEAQGGEAGVFSLSWEPTSMPDPAPPKTARTSKPAMLERVKGMFGRSTTTSLSTHRSTGESTDAQQTPVASPLVRVPSIPGGANPTIFGSQNRTSFNSGFSSWAARATSEGGLPPPEHNQGQAASSKKSAASALASIGNSFAKRVAAAREQPRITPPMVQPKVNVSDLEALRMRMSMQAGAKAAAEAGHATKEATPVSTRSLSCAGTQDCPALQQKQSRSRDSSVHGAISCPGIEDTSGKGSRLRRASNRAPAKSTSDLKEGSLSQVVAQRASSIAASTPKWFSKLAGPSLSRTRSGDDS